MSGSTFKARALPSLLSGVARQPLPPTLGLTDDRQAALRALSLTGQALRFERPATPAYFETEPEIEDQRKLLPDELRRPMLRVLTGKTATEHPALAIARVLDERRLRPHPFDFPRLDAFVRHHADQLGSTAQHWARSKSAEPEQPGYYDQVDLDETNWTQGTPARRATFLDGLRKQDPNQARSLLEAAWPNEYADTRSRLLQAMHTNLNQNDRAFLESLEKDRSPRVRQLAKRLLGRLGVVADNPALAAALERITRKQSGLLRKRPVLALELPATMKEASVPDWIRETFADVTLEELSRALSLTPLEIIEASAKDSNLSLALAMIATTDIRLDLLELIVAHVPTAWESMSFSGWKDLGIMARDERLRFADILIRPYGNKLPWNYPAWSWLHTVLDGHAPVSLLEAAFKSTWFDEPPSVAKHTPYWMEVTAALCPSPQRQALRQCLEAFDPALTATALPLLHLLDQLEKA